MRIEPAAALVGHVVVPGDKSISHRAVLIGALGEGVTQVHGFGRSGDTQASWTRSGVSASRSRTSRTTTSRVRGVGLRGLGAGSVDCRNSGTLMRLLSGVVAGRAASSRSPGTIRSPRARWNGLPRRCGEWGRRRDDGRARAAHDPRLGRPARDRDRAGGGERAGEVGDPPRRAQRRRGDDRDRAHPDARPHRAHARGRRSADSAQRKLSDDRAGRRAAARRGRRAG